MITHHQHSCLGFQNQRRLFLTIPSHLEPIGLMWGRIWPLSILPINSLASGCSERPLKVTLKSGVQGNYAESAEFLNHKTIMSLNLWDCSESLEIMMNLWLGWDGRSQRRSGLYQERDFCKEWNLWYKFRTDVGRWKIRDILWSKMNLSHWMIWDDRKWWGKVVVW